MLNYDNQVRCLTLSHALDYSTKLNEYLPNIAKIKSKNTIYSVCKMNALNKGMEQKKKNCQVKNKLI